MSALDDQQQAPLTAQIERIVEDLQKRQPPKLLDTIDYEHPPSVNSILSIGVRSGDAPVSGKMGDFSRNGDGIAILIFIFE